MSNAYTHTHAHTSIHWNKNRMNNRIQHVLDEKWLAFGCYDEKFLNYYHAKPQSAIGRANRSLRLFPFLQFDAAVGAEPTVLLLSIWAHWRFTCAHVARHTTAYWCADRGPRTEFQWTITTSRRSYGFRGSFLIRLIRIFLLSIYQKQDVSN